MLGVEELTAHPLYNFFIIDWSVLKFRRKHGLGRDWPEFLTQGA